VRLAEIMKV